MSPRVCEEIRISVLPPMKSNSHCHFVTRVAFEETVRSTVFSGLKSDLISLAVDFLHDCAEVISMLLTLLQ